MLTRLLRCGSLKERARGSSGQSTAWCRHVHRWQSEAIPLVFSHLSPSLLLRSSLQLLTPSLCLKFSDSCLAQPFSACPGPHYCIKWKHLLSPAPCCFASTSPRALAWDKTTLPCLSAAVISVERCCSEPPSHSQPPFVPQPPLSN